MLITLTGQTIVFFQFEKSKSDQFGKNGDKLWYVSAIPKNSTTFTVLYLYRCIVSKPGVLVGVVTNNGGGMKSKSNKGGLRDKSIQVSMGKYFLQNTSTIYSCVHFTRYLNFIRMHFCT